MLRPNLLRFVLTPITAKERCRLVRNQLEQLQYEHSQLLSHTGRQTESNNELPVENEFGRANESTQGCKPGLVGMDREERPDTGYELKVIQSHIEAAERRHKEMESDLDNLLRDKSDLEREVASVKSKLEVETLQLKAERHIHSRITFQIQSRRELEKSSVETRRELRENVAEVKNLVKRVQDENAIFAGYIMRKKAKLVGNRFMLFCVKCTSTVFSKQFSTDIVLCTVSKKLPVLFDHPFPTHQPILLYRRLTSIPIPLQPSLFSLAAHTEVFFVW